MNIYDWDTIYRQQGAQASVPDDASTIVFHGLNYARLTGTALRQTIVGTQMNYDERDVVITLARGRWFDSNGTTYWVHPHRGPPISGSYEISIDKVCTRLNEHGGCFALFRNQANEVLMLGLGGGSRPVRVVFVRYPPEG